MHSGRTGDDRRRRHRPTRPVRRPRLWLAVPLVALAMIVGAGCGSSGTTTAAGQPATTVASPEQSQADRVLVDQARESQEVVVHLHELAVRVAAGETDANVATIATDLQHRLQATIANIRRLGMVKGRDEPDASALTAALTAYVALATSLAGGHGTAGAPSTTASVAGEPATPSTGWTGLRSSLVEADQAYRRALAAIDARTGGSLQATLLDLPLPPEGAVSTTTSTASPAPTNP
jgi:hypothetical protein